MAYPGGGEGAEATPAQNFKKIKNFYIKSVVSIGKSAGTNNVF